MKTKRLLALLALAALTACSKAPDDPAAVRAGPDNAVTRYGENLATAPDKAQQNVDKMNAAIHNEHQSLNSSTEQPQ